MIEESELTKKREEIKNQLSAGEYKTLTDLILDGTGRFIQKLTRSSQPPSFWYSAVVVALVSWLVGLFVSILLGENSETVPYSFGLEGILLQISAVGLFLMFMILPKIYLGMFRAASRDYLLDAVELVTDLTDFQHRLAAFGNVRKTLFFSLVYGILAGVVGSVYTSILKGGFVGFGLTIFVMIFWIATGMGTYYVLVFLVFIVRLGRYRFKLYAVDPSNSEIIDHLSGLLMNGVYLMAVLAASAILFLFSFELLNVVTMVGSVPVGWAPLIAVFVITQITLRKIITRAKWQELNQIQIRIERLKTEEDIEDKDTMEKIERLIGYHNQILRTPNSALDLRAGLNFLNSLLIPLLAFILANLDKVLALFQAE